MDHRKLHFLLVFLALAILASAARFMLPALAIEHHPKTVEMLKTEAVAAATSTPSHRKIRVLIVPGHEPNNGGTVSANGLKERDLAVQLGKQLQAFLGADGRFETVLSRDEKGWNPDIEKYFNDHWTEIETWRKDARAEMDARIASGEVAKPQVTIGHNNAPQDVAIRLYGITKWADEHDIDLMVHIHFDDDRRSSRAPGYRTGFAVFVPPPQYYNGSPSRQIGAKVLARLHAFDPIGNLKGEIAAGGLVDDPQLIAVGEQNTSDAASMLIEYAFIYEKQLKTPSVRALAVRDQAYQTALGLQDFFFGDEPAHASSVLPYAWKGSVRADSDPADVYALQTALTLDGDFPPSGRSMNTCPRSGQFGPCTRSAIDSFQKKHGISGEPGFAGPETLAKLVAP